MSGGAEPVGTIEVALSHTARLLGRDPALAAEQATEILKVAPRHPVATLLLGAARRLSGRTRTALEILEPLAREQPNWAAAQYEQGLALSSAGQPAAAIASLQRAVALKPDLAEAWRALGDELTSSGDSAGADAAYAQHIKASVNDPRLRAAAAALCENRIPQAEALLRAHLKQAPTDVAALRMLAEVAARLRRLEDAQTLLERCLELAPSFAAARHNYAVVLHRRNQDALALQQAELLLGAEPHNPGYRNLKAVVLAKLGDYGQSIELYTQLLAKHPHQPKIWMSYGHTLKTNGREADSIAAYEKSIELLPSLGEAYWSLANLKTVRFTDQQIQAMRTQLARADLADDDRFHLHFALGKALEDAGVYAESFENYSEGNRIRRATLPYSADALTGLVARSRSLLTHEFFAARSGWGNPAPDPIFIVGLPRSGSTLLEQILASHSLVEGTMELPDIQAIVRELRGRTDGPQERSYPELLASLTQSECHDLGTRYLEGTRVQRKTGAPFFVDKMPNNFAHLGLIRLILPNAKIIDARRHPLGCCFSAFKQHFARGQSFSYSLDDLGRYYRDYVALMAHFDAALPGWVHRIFYESVVEATEAEIRRLLEYCGLPFEPQCLRFYENERAVRTASSQQVRQPIYKASLDQWRHFEPWLEPLKTALGPVLDHYPQVPEFGITPDIAYARCEGATQATKGSHS
ncbi:MAG TPA: sulfotransferase [Steroidobacteraceae bacterium]|nr:sulfotransferase [Steroidobacteraceae bacterium]